MGSSKRWETQASVGLCPGRHGRPFIGLAEGRVGGGIVLIGLTIYMMGIIVSFWSCRQSSVQPNITYGDDTIIVPAVPRKGFGSVDCDTIYTIYLSLCTQSADPNPFFAQPV